MSIRHLAPRRIIQKWFSKIKNRQIMQFSDTGDKDQSNEHSSNEKIKIPPPPTNCCMSGCANCVWIQYAEDLNKLFKDGGETARKLIMDEIEDENLKAFLSMELRMMKLRKKS